MECNKLKSTLLRLESKTGLDFLAFVLITLHPSLKKTKRI